MDCNHIIYFLSMLPGESRNNIVIWNSPEAVVKLSLDLISDHKYMILLFADSIVRYHVFRQRGSLLLDPCNTCIKQRNIDGIGYLSNRYFWSYHAAVRSCKDH